MILIDASVLVAFANKDDSNHLRAVEIIEEIEEGRHGGAIVLDLVFSEAMTVIALKLKNKAVALKFGEIVQGAYGIAFSNEQLFKHSVEFFRQTSSLSFADCAQLAYCKLYGAKAIATFDGDLSKAGGASIVN